jgi:hypothetical protein
MAPVLKTGIPERVSGVRIPPSPPCSLNYREILPTLPLKFANYPVFRDYSQTSRTAENGLLVVTRSQCLAFSPESRKAVRFRGLPEANAMRSQTDDVAKPA